ncbi:MAG: hypothetical protein LBC18_11865 [Opitutaceae bacterium]|jgi:hypothetical protein|nr:hypothetical protein [Opitutaceae bacterium]
MPPESGRKQTAPAIWHAPGTHPAVIRAAARLAGALGGITSAAPGGAAAAGFRVGTWSEIMPVSENKIQERAFSIFERDGAVVFTGDRPRSVLAGVLYYLHHQARGTLGGLPVRRRSPHRDRLILEDFAANTYQPTGFDFDLECYAENLVALGYTAMECNRLSQAEPVHAFFDGYQFTNPSPALFVWTKWHEGVWPEERIRSHAAGLRRCIETARAFDLEPAITSFVPRTFPEAFFQRHPRLRGSSFRHEYLRRGNHPAYYRIDTDNPEGLAFYRAIYTEIFRLYPDIRHLFFWHADLGTRFWPDGEGPLKRREVDRIAEFHRMLDEVLTAARCAARVWINPWAMPENCLDELNREVNPRVGYAVKDNTGAAHFCGTTLVKLGDLTIFHAHPGALPRRIRELAAGRGREVCLCQYQDFSEDLDPVLGVPHPLLTFRKFKSLREYGPDISSTNWGVLSPDSCPVNPNQDVIREMTWTAADGPPETFVELLPRLVPAARPEIRDGICKAWLKIDLALQMWPQFWGLRLQDNGLRFRWLVKPLILSPADLTEDQKSYYLDAQIYRMDSPDPFDDFTPISPGQVMEISAIYDEMITLFHSAETRMAALAAAAKGEGVSPWIEKQTVPVKWLRLFFTTFRNQFSFHAIAEKSILTPAHRAVIADEIRNTTETLRHLAAHPRSLIIATRGKWGQCLGPDIAGDFERKLALLNRAHSS